VNPFFTPSLNMNDELFSRFKNLIHERIGFKYNDARRDTLYRALSKGCKHEGYSSLEQYYAALQAHPDHSPIWEELIKSLTICETYFFRDPDQIDVLRHNILPDLVARRWNERTLRIWSAGCSTGEEPYTLAILLRQVIPDIDRWKISILGTDINKNALHLAAQAKYRDWSFRQSDENLIQHYFTKVGNDYGLNPAIKEMVKFEYLNITENSYPSVNNGTNQIDLILCRNVTIYLSELAIQQAANRFYQSLSPGGWLVVGPSETNDQIYRQFHVMRFEKAIVYQKLDNASRNETQWTDPALKDLANEKRFTLAGLHHLGHSAADRVQNLKPLVDQYYSHAPPSPSAEPFISQRETRFSAAPIPQQDEGNLAFYQQALVFLKQRRFEEARKCFTIYLQHAPADTQAQVQFALMEANSGRKEEAQRLAHNIIQNDPLNIDAYYILAQLHQENGDVDEAVTTFKKVLYLSPDHILAHFNLAKLYQKQGHPKESSRHHHQAVYLAGQFHPDDILPGSDDLSIADFLNMVHT
jgi:chemotaxis protein methyltransferase CheR